MRWASVVCIMWASWNSLRKRDHYFHQYYWQGRFIWQHEFPTCSRRLFTGENISLPHSPYFISHLKSYPQWVDPKNGIEMSLFWVTRFLQRGTLYEKFAGKKADRFPQHQILLRKSSLFFLSVPHRTSVRFWRVGFSNEVILDPV